MFSRFDTIPAVTDSHPASHVAVANTLYAIASRLKTTWEVVSTGEVLWSARLNTNKVTANRQEDRSSQWEATKKSVGLQGWSSSTEIDLNDGERRLFDISSA